MAVQPGEIPSKSPFVFDGTVGEAFDLSQSDVVTLDDAGDDPSARGSEVDRGEDPRSHRQRKKAAATPASTGTSNPVVWLNSSEVSAAMVAATCSGNTSRLSSVRCA